MEPAERTSPKTTNHQVLMDHLWKIVGAILVSSVIASYRSKAP